jgi:hypothetical protein
MTKEIAVKLNWKEERVITALVAGPASIADLRRKCFPGVRPATKGDRQVRNSLRKPMKLRLVVAVGDGTYAAAAPALTIAAQPAESTSP